MSSLLHYHVVIIVIVVMMPCMAINQCLHHMLHVISIGHVPILYVHVCHHLCHCVSSPEDCYRCLLAQIICLTLIALSLRCFVMRYLVERILHSSAFEVRPLGRFFFLIACTSISMPTIHAHAHMPRIAIRLIVFLLSYVKLQDGEANIIIKWCYRRCRCYQLGCECITNAIASTINMVEDLKLRGWSAMDGL